MRLTQMVEALLFASDAPLTAADLARVDERLDEDTVAAVIEELRAEYDRTERSFQIVGIAGGYQLLTRPEFVAILERYQTVPQTGRLSMPALEVLAIIAYRQPLGRLEIEEIRGVQSAAVLRTLQDRELIEPVGRADALGRPLLYGTTRRFLEHFGFDSLEDLPRPDELPVVLRPAAPAEPHAGQDAFGPAGTRVEPSPLSEDAAHEAEALRLDVQPARSHAEEQTEVEPGDALASAVATIADTVEAGRSAESMDGGGSAADAGEARGESA